MRPNTDTNLRLARQRAAAWLSGAGLRPTRQRLTLAELLVGDGQDRHVCAEGLFEAVIHDELDRAYTDLRTDLNHALRPELSELASAFLAELTDHRYSELELDDQYNIVVLEDGRPKPVLSGGEEDLANLALRLAISQMIAERAGQAFSLIVLDEIFGSLDNVRRHNVVGLLKKLHDQFEQIILITHIESVSEDLDRVITVGYDEESGSSVVQSNQGGYPALELLDGALEGAGADV
jgi:exonuclease SbcC